MKIGIVRVGKNSVKWFPCEFVFTNGEFSILNILSDGFMSKNEALEACARKIVHCPPWEKRIVFENRKFWVDDDSLYVKVHEDAQFIDWNGPHTPEIHEE